MDGVTNMKKTKDTALGLAVSAVIPGSPLAGLGKFLERRVQSNRLQLLKDWQTWLRANRAHQDSEE